MRSARKTRRKFSSEEKIRIVLEGLRGEETIAELCRREGISPNLYYNLEQGVPGGREAASAGEHEAGGDEFGGGSRFARRTGSSGIWLPICRCAMRF